MYFCKIVICSPSLTRFSVSSSKIYQKLSLGISKSWHFLVISVKTYILPCFSNFPCWVYTNHCIIGENYRWVNAGEDNVLCVVCEIRRFWTATTTYNTRTLVFKSFSCLYWSKNETLEIWSKTSKWLIFSMLSLWLVKVLFAVSLYL